MPAGAAASGDGQEVAAGWLLGCAKAERGGRSARATEFSALQQAEGARWLRQRVWLAPLSNNLTAVSAEMLLKLAALQPAATSIVTCSTCP